MQSLYPLMSCICINYRGREVLIKIAGGGVRGLSCAIEFLNNGYEVEIYETRQEIGNPIRSPGIIKNLEPEFVEHCNAKENSFGWAVRREWLEKQLAIKVLEKGGEIILKTEAPSDAIDCRGGKSSSPGWPSDNLDNSLKIWNGGITISNNLPEEFEIDSMDDEKFCFEHSDGLIECWIRGELPETKQGWLEIIQGEHPSNSENIWADESIQEGRDIAKRIIQSLQQVS